MILKDLDVAVGKSKSGDVFECLRNIPFSVIFENQELIPILTFASHHKSIVFLNN